MNVLPQFAYVACTKPNSERYASDFLSRLGFSLYFPQVLVRHSHARKVSVVPRPFLPRYLFVWDDDCDLSLLRTAPGVSAILRCGESVARISRSVVETIKSRENTDGYVQLEGAKALTAAAAVLSFEKGEVVRPNSGPFSGLNSVFETYSGEERAEIFVSIFGRATLVTMDVRQLEKV